MMSDETFETVYQPTIQDVAFYRAHGWWVSPAVVPEDLLDQALQGMERYYAGKRDFLLPAISGYLDWKPEHGAVLRLNSYVSLQIEEFQKLVHTPVIGAIAAALMGTTTVRLWRDSLWYKPPQEDAAETLVGWHVDRAYWLTCSSDEMLTAWIPFQDCDEEMGTITMIDGSHCWPNNDNLRTSREQDLEGLRARFQTAGSPVVEVPIRMKRGQISFHHCRTIHGSYANRTRRPRVALAIHLQDDGNHYRRCVGPEGKPLGHLNDLLCRKVTPDIPDYTDPTIFPTLWSAGACGRGRGT